jgi:hypothetical protein
MEIEEKCNSHHYKINLGWNFFFFFEIIAFFSDMILNHQEKNKGKRLVFSFYKLLINSLFGVFIEELVISISRNNLKNV